MENSPRRTAKNRSLYISSRFSPGSSGFRYTWRGFMAVTESMTTRPGGGAPGRRWSISWANTS